MVDLLDEVRADLKEEQTVGLLKKYGTFTVVIMGFILFAMTGNLWWKSYQESKIHREGGDFLVSALKMRANKLDLWTGSCTQTASEFRTAGNL